MSISAILPMLTNRNDRNTSKTILKYLAGFGVLGGAIILFIYLGKKFDWKEKIEGFFGGVGEWFQGLFSGVSEWFQGFSSGEFFSSKLEGWDLNWGSMFEDALPDIDLPEDYDFLQKKELGEAELEQLEKFLATEEFDDPLFEQKLREVESALRQALTTDTWDVGTAFENAIEEAEQSFLDAEPPEILDDIKNETERITEPITDWVDDVGDNLGWW